MHFSSECIHFYLSSRSSILNYTIDRSLHFFGKKFQVTSTNPRNFFLLFPLSYCTCLFPFTWNAHCGALPLFTIQAGYSSYPCFSPLDQIPSFSLALSLRSINQVIFFLQLCNLLRHKLDFAHTYWKMIP